MNDVATKRKREGKDTVLTYGGRVYTKQQAANTLARSKRVCADHDVKIAGFTDILGPYLNQSSKNCFDTTWLRFRSNSAGRCSRPAA